MNDAQSRIRSRLEVGAASLLLCIALFVNRLGAMTKMFLPLYLVAERQYRVEEAVALMSSYGLGLFVGAYVLGFMADHIPPRKVAVCAFVGSAAFLALLTVPLGRETLIAILVFAGLFDSGANVLGQRLLLETAIPSERPQVQALIRVGNNLGAACAGLLCGSLARYSFNAVFIFDAVCSLAAAWIVLRKIPDSARSAKPGFQVRASGGGNPLLDLPFLTFEAGVLLIAMSYHALYFALGNYVIENYAGTASDVGLQFSINAILIVTLQIAVTKRLSAKNIYLVTLFGAALLASGFMLLYVGRTPTQLTISTVIWSLGEIALFPLINLAIMRHAEGRRSGQYFGVAAAAWNSAALITPLAIASITLAVGLKFVWIACAIACCASTVLMLIGLHFFSRNSTYRNSTNE